jgi:hypothetical protein
MDTREQSREERLPVGRAGALFGVGLAVGFGLGIVMGKTLAAGIELGWATHLLALGLGAIGVLATWWALGYEVKRTKRQED